MEELISLMEMLNGFKKFSPKFYEGLVGTIEDQLRLSKAQDIIDALWSMRQVFKNEPDRLQQLAI